MYILCVSSQSIKHTKLIFLKIELDNYIINGFRDFVKMQHIDWQKSNKIKSLVFCVSYL